MVKTVLVVEDDIGIATLVKEALEAVGLQVVVEKDGEGGLRAAQRHRPDVVLTDLLLPGMAGFELLDKVRALPGGSSIGVVVMSGIYRSARHKAMARDRYGAVASIDKPFDLDVLIAAVRQAAGIEVPLPVADVVPRVQRAPVDRADVEKAVRGNLKQRRFPEVLAQLFRFKATGALLLRRGRIKKIVYVKDGAPVFVKSNMLSECLGRVLVREKMITEEECERSVELLPGSNGKLQGQVLIDMGALSPQNLAFGLQLQLEQKLYDVFSWPDGDYQFNSRGDFPEQHSSLDVTLANLIYEGVRRKFTDVVVNDLLERSIDLYLTPHPEPNHKLGDFVLDADERILLALVDGRRTARDVIDASGLTPRVARQLVYTLIAAELAQTSRRAATFAKPPVIDVPRPPQRPAPASPPPLPPRASTAPKKTPLGEPAVATVVEDVESVDALRTRLVERQRLLRRANHFEVLGVSVRADLDEVQRARAAHARELSPERLQRRLGGGVPADVRSLAEQILYQVEAAAEVLGDSRRRSEYEARLAHKPRTEVQTLLAAETLVRQGEAAWEAGKDADAVVAFTAAQALLPAEGELLASLAWAKFLVARADPVVQAEAIVQLQNALELAPRYDRGWFWCGRVLQQAGRPGEARKHFERAVHCNPEHREAQAALRS
jgi:CheY-like chemotaxis protein